MAIDNDKLLAAIDARSSGAYGGQNDSSLQEHRAKLIDAYLGLNTNPAPEGRSQVVDRSVFETVQTMLPSLVRIFSGSSDEVVKFVPIGPDDEPAAEQTTGYINYVACQLNPWEQFCSDWIFDALMSPNSYAMAYWDESKTAERETYEGLTEEQLAVIVQDGGKVIEHTPQPDPEQDKLNQQAYQQAQQQYQMMAAQAAQQQMGQPGPMAQPMGQGLPPAPQPPPPAMLHDVVIEREEQRGKVKLCVLPPENVRVDADCPDWTLNECDYFEYRQEKSIAWLQETFGSDAVDIDISDSEDIDTTPESNARDRFGEGAMDEDEGGDLMRDVVVRTIWVRCDAGKEGKACLYRCVVVGRTVLYAEQVSRIHAASMVAQPLPHRHPGMSVAETVLDIQDVKTFIKRGGLDNLHLAVNGRYALSDKVNLDDFLDSRPGSAVRLRDGAMPGEGHIFPLTHPFALDQIIGSMEYFDQERQNRSGVSRYFSGTDAGAINKTASGTMALQNMAAQRVEHVARMMAPAFESLFSIIHELVSKHQQKADIIKLRGKWVNVDPTAWLTRRDVRISVGVGAGNRDAMLAQLTMQGQEQMMMGPVGIVTPENLYQTMIEKAKLQGFSNPERFWTDPSTQPPKPQQPPPEIVVEQMRLQHQEKVQAVNFQTHQTDSKLELAKFQAEQEQKAQLEREQMAQDAALRQYEADKAAQTTLQVEQMKLGGQVEIEAARLQTSQQQKLIDVAAEKEMAQFNAQNAAQQEAQRAANTPPDHSKEHMQEAMKAMAAAIDRMSKPKTIIRDGDGRVMGVKVSD